MEELIGFMVLICLFGIIINIFKSTKTEVVDNVVYYSTDPRYNYMLDVVHILNDIKTDHEKVLYLMSIMPTEKVDHMKQTLDMVERVATIVQPTVRLIR